MLSGYAYIKNLRLILGCLLFAGSLGAQSNVDSLLGIWNDPNQEDSTRIRAYTTFITENLISSNPDSAIASANTLLEFSEQQSNQTGAAIGLNLLGVLYRNKSDYPRALELSQRALETAQATGYQKGIGQALSNIGTIYYNQSNYDEAYRYYQQSLEVREALGDRKEISSAFNVLGVYYYAVNNYPKSLEYFQKSLKIREEIGEQLLANQNLFNIAAIYSSQGDYLKALDYYQRSLAINEELGDKAGIGNSLAQIGQIYNIQGSYENALEYQRQSLQIRTELGDKAGIGNSLSSIGLIYKNQGDYQEAMKSLEESLKIREEVGDKRRISYCLNNIGEVYYEMGLFSTAQSYFEKSLAIKEEIGDRFGLSYTLNNLGQLQVMLEDYQKAYFNCRQAYDISSTIGNVGIQKDACDCLYEVNKAMGEDQDALFYLENRLILEDSIKSIETVKKLQQIEFAKQLLADSLAQVERAREVELEHQAEIQQKNRNRNIAVGIGIFFLFLATVFFGVWRYTQESKELVEQEKDRSDRLLLNILPAEVAEELKAKGRAEAKSHELVTILFTDFKDFTKTSTQLSAQDLVEEINTCFEKFDRIVEQYGIEKIKTIGDSYMAAGGLAQTALEAVKLTILAALDMQAFIIERKAKRDLAGQPAFYMRAGIHSGPVVAGVVGVKKFQYDVWGDTVNTASRMESHGEIGMVNISDDTYHLLKSDPELEFENRGEITVKGKEPIQMWFVRRAKGKS